MDNKPVHILLVEDEPDHVDLIRRAFSRRAGKTKLTVASGVQEAFAVLAQSTPDLVIADYQLPDGDGIDILQANRDDRCLPIVVMTSHGNEQIAVEALKRGASDYVVKSAAALEEIPRVAERTLREWEQRDKRKRAEEAMRESETRFRELFDNMSSGVAVYEAVDDGRDFVFKDFNKAGQTIEQLGREEVLGNRLTEVFPGVEQFGLLEVLRRVHRTGIPEQHPVSLYRDERIVGWRQSYVYRLPSGEVVAVYDDLTEQKQAEEKLRQSEAKRAEAERLAAAGRMAARIAHEINNPLAGIKSAFQLVKKAVAKDHPRHGYVAMIEKEISRISNTVHQMLDLHRAEREVESDVSIGSTIRDVVSMVEPLSREHNVSVVAETHECPPILRLPENGLRQVLYNLLTNAIEASPEEGIVTVRASAAEGRLRMSIADQGPGVPAELGLKIFEPFFTTKDANATGGLGLGLSISKGIVEAFGGSLGFGSRPGESCLLEIVIPVGGSTDE